MTSNKTPTIVLVGGGSGGHVIPCLVLGKRWLAQCPDGNVVLITDVTRQRQWFNDALSEMPTTNFSVSLLSLAKRSGSRFRQLLMLPLMAGQLIATVVKSFFVLRKLKPEKIISTGGFVSLPVCVAAWLQRYPIELYELNAEPGLAVMFLARFATTIMLPFPITHPKLPATKCQTYDYPLRYSTADRDDSSFNKKEFLETIGFDSSRTTLFILGGSQGSVSLNKALKDFFLTMHDAAQKVQVIHQTGEYDAAGWQEFYRTRNIVAHTFAYQQSLKNFYRAADLVITRAGAGTLFELLFFGKHSIVVPLITKTTAHQRENALGIARLKPELFTVVHELAEVPKALQSKLMV